ncbi:MAG TPA: hypothetical protein VF300_04100 [Methanothrix sp.]
MTMAWKEIGAIGIILIVVMTALPTVSASKDSLSDLRSLISGFDDPLINSDDLAFYLVTHDFDATPKGEYVEVDLVGNVYKLTPNGSAPGLCSIES